MESTIDQELFGVLRGILATAKVSDYSEEATQSHYVFLDINKELEADHEKHLKNRLKKYAAFFKEFEGESSMIDGQEKALAKLRESRDEETTAEADDEAPEPRKRGFNGGNGQSQTPAPKTAEKPVQKPEPEPEPELIQNPVSIAGGNDMGAGLAGKLVAIMNAIEALPKDKRNERQNYDYAGADAYYNVARSELIKHKIALFPNAISARRIEEREKGGDITIITFQFKLMDTETGETMTCTWIGEAADTGDKGSSKAATNAMKSWLRTTFLIPTEETENNTRNQSQRGRNR